MAKKPMSANELTNPTTDPVKAAINDDELSTSPIKKVKAAIGKQDETGDKTITPITVGNPAAVASLAIDQSHLEEFVNAEQYSSIVRCRRPPKGIFFTVRPEPTKPWKNRAFYFLLEMEGRDPYLVAPEVANQKADEDVIRPVLIVRYVTMSGEEGLWPLKLDQPDTKSNPWNKSALNILELAQSGWVRIASAKTHYRHQVSNRTFDECPPKFSDRTFFELIDTAFKDRTILGLDHEIWIALDNGSIK
jgi:hypothetical protein